MKRPAFTLIELIVVLAILGATIFVAQPGLRRFSASLELNAQAKALAVELRQLQSQARLTHSLQKHDNSKIAFAASGFPPPGGSGTIVLKNRFNQTKKVIVSSSGRVRIE